MSLVVTSEFLGGAGRPRNVFNVSFFLLAELSAVGLEISGIAADAPG